LGLIDASDNTQDILRELIDTQEDSQEERQVLGGLLTAKYARVFELNLKTATPGALADTIGGYGVTGATRKRAVRFFIKAATHAGIQLSTRLTNNLREHGAANGEDGAQPSGETGDTTTSQPVATFRAPRRRRRQAPPPPPPPAPITQPSTNNAMKTIQLPNVGGSLAISGTFNPFGLMGDERELVYKIIDMMNDFEQKKKTASE